MAETVSKKGFELELGLELFQIFFLTAKKIWVQGFSNFSDLVGELFCKTFVLKKKIARKVFGVWKVPHRLQNKMRIR